MLTAGFRLLDEVGSKPAIGWVEFLLVWGKDLKWLLLACVASIFAVFMLLPRLVTEYTLM